MALALATAMGGCGGDARTPPSAAEGGAPPKRMTDAEAAKLAAAVAQRLGWTPAAHARATLRVQNAGQDPQSFQLNLWCAPDGAVRLNGTSHDVEFVSARVAADGAYRAWLPRAKLGSSGDLHDAGADGAASPLLLQLAVISGELTAGPLPPKGPFTAGARANSIACPAGGGLTAEVDIDRAELTVTAKRLMGADGAVVATIEYSRYQTFDEQRRPTRATIAIPGDATAYVFTVGAFNGLPVISDERMRLELPTDAKPVPLHDLFQHLGD